MSGLWEAEEMACEVLGLDYDTWCNSDNPTDLDDELMEAFDGLSMDIFERLLEVLARFTIISESPLTKSHFQGFVKPEEKRYIYRIDYKEKT